MGRTFVHSREKRSNENGIKFEKKNNHLPIGSDLHYEMLHFNWHFNFEHSIKIITCNFAFECMAK